MIAMGRILILEKPAQNIPPTEIPPIGSSKI